ncbi:MAG: haloacid dehalogenase type II [Geminicoccaceae bacterium]
MTAGPPDLSAIRACVFDAYGTLLDFNSAVARERETIGERADALSELWRRKQLEYTWLRSLMRRHADFRTVTGEALDYSLAAMKIEDEALRERLMASYDSLDTYPEVPAMLAGLKQAGMATAILSNGSPAMLEAGVASAGIGDHLDALLSVESAGVFKPAPEVYQLATARFGIAANEVLFLSSNGWDIHGAASFGFRCIWVNRAGAPVERLPERPLHILSSLAPLAGLVKGR